MAGRVSQKVVETLYQPDERRIRVSQKVVETLYTPDERRVRVSQMLVEVLYQQPPSLAGEQFIWID